MKRKSFTQSFSKSFWLLCLFMLSSTICVNAQDDLNQMVTKINDNPGAYSQEFVTIMGTVTQYTPKTANTTANYLVQDDYGSVIQVNTNNPDPETNEKYKITGTVIIDGLTGQPYIVEQNREELKILPPIPEVKPTEKPEPEKSSINWTLVIILGGSFLLLVILIIILFARRSKDKMEEYPGESEGDYKEAPTAPAMENDFKTIKITTETSKTLKFIPGKLVIVSGVDKGKEFMISGYPTNEGNIITIGRDEVKGDRSYAHIQLKQRTVSRKQAELISRGDLLFIKNLSETNLSQLDGIELQPGEEKQLKADSIIKTGEIEFKYKI